MLIWKGDARMTEKHVTRLLLEACQKYFGGLTHCLRLMVLGFICLRMQQLCGTMCRK